jgi:hypothetical protein
MTNLQFRVLYRVFLLRIVDVEVLSTDSDPVKLLGQLAALLAAVSFMFTAPLILVGAKLPQVDLWTMEHLLIATTMVMVGIFSVLTWDAIFPDRRDLLVLAPLPVRPQALFVAKLSAMAVALSLSILALNIFSGLVWPFWFSPEASGATGAVRSITAYWLTVVASAIFMFCSVLGVQWGTAQLLTRQKFLRTSAFLQVLAFCLFLSVYILEPSLESVQALTDPKNQRLLTWLPSYWFLGLFQELNGSMNSAYAPLAARAHIALTVSIFGAGTAVSLSYFRTLRKIVEEPDILPSSRRTKWRPHLGSSVLSAVVLFSVRTLLRSRQHRVILSFYLGVGFAIVLAYVKPSFSQRDTLFATITAQSVVPLLAASLLMMCFTVVGIRAVFAIPVALRANWIFRITETYTVSKYLSAVRSSLIVLACVPVWVVSSILFLAIWPPRLAVGHLVILGLTGVCLAELCLYDFRKIPFTCSYLPGKANIQFVFWACVIMLPLMYSGAQFEWRALQKGTTYAATVVVYSIVATLVIWRTIIAANAAHELEFDEPPPVDVLSLRLSTTGESLRNDTQ